jgi:hypothetical protein
MLFGGNDCKEDNLLMSVKTIDEGQELFPFLLLVPFGQDQRSLKAKREEKGKFNKSIQNQQISVFFLSRFIRLFVSLQRI